MKDSYLEKRLKINERNLKYDFMPSMLEITEKPANRWSNVIMFSVIALIVSTICWAKFTYTDIAVTSRGSVMPEGGLSEIKSMYSGNAADIKVKEGDFVSSGTEVLSVSSFSQQNYSDSDSDSDSGSVSGSGSGSGSGSSGAVFSVKAPVSGTVTQLTVVNRNAPVTAGETIGYIVPQDRQMIFTTYVADENMRKIKPDEEVNIKIDAFASDDRFLPGKVKSVASVASGIDGVGSAYKVDVLPERLPDDVRIGMEGDCDILVGKRSVLDYFLEPFVKGFGESLKEQ